MFEPADLLAATHAVVLMSLDHRLVPTANDAVEKNRLKCAPVEMVEGNEAEWRTIGTPRYLLLHFLSPLP